MDSYQKELFLRYSPHIYQDKRDPFPIRYIGCTLFTEKAPSNSFPKWAPDPGEADAQYIIEYAIYYDYDIQHMYDLEHVWVAVGHHGEVTDCWCSFHGMRLRAAGISSFRMEGDHPVLYSQPGKHALLPHPELFGLHPQFETACTVHAGGGLLVPDMFRPALSTTEALDKKISGYIRSRFAFQPSLEFIPESLEDWQFLPWSALHEKIPVLIREQLCIVTGE